MKLKNVVVVGAALSLAAAVGCSKGSGHEFTPVGGGVSTGAGALTSALPAISRAPSYGFESYQLNALAGTGRVTALAAASVGSQVLASHAPGSTAALIANGTAADEQAVSFYEASSMASIDSGATFLATRDVQQGADAGQVFVRSGTSWTVSLNPGLSEATVAKVGSQIYAFTGQEGSPGRVYLYNEQGGQFTEIAAVNSSIPQRGAELAGTVYVGGMQNAANGGAAQLYRLTGTSLQEVALPAGLAVASGLGVRQEVTDMLSVTFGTVSGGTATTGSATAATLGYVQDIATLVQQDCGACHAVTGIVGSSMLLNSAAATTDYATIMAQVNTGNPAGSSLLLKGSGNNHGGGSPWADTSAQYATVLQWITEGAIENGSAGSPGSTGGSAVSGQLIFLAVGAFGRDTGQASGGSLLAYNGQDFEVMANYVGDAPTSLAWIDNTLYVGTAAGTLSYRADNGLMVAETSLPTNTGVLALLARDGDTLAIGARTQDGGFVYLRTPGAAAPAPAPTPNPTPSGLSYATDVAPLLSTACGACHSSQGIVGAAMLFADNTAANDYAIVLAQVNTADPANSALLLKASNTTTHTGGGPWAVGSAQHTTVLTWIQGGAAQ